MLYMYDSHSPSPTNLMKVLDLHTSSIVASNCCRLNGLVGLELEIIT